MDDEHGQGPTFASSPVGPGTASMPAPPAPALHGSLGSAEGYSQVPPARRFPHVVRFIFAVIGWVGVSIGVFLVVVDSLTKDLYGSVAARDAAFASATPIAFLASAVWVLVTMSLIARLVGYRLRDALFTLIPFYSYVFQLKMLWRWTALPDGDWDRPSIPISLAPGVAPAPRRVLRSADPFIAIMCVLALVGFVWFSEEVDDPSVTVASDDWKTVNARGMTIDVPEGLIVTTDPADAARMLSEVGDPGAEELGEVLTQFPDFFVMMAVEPSLTEGVSISVFRFPSGGAPLRVSARGFAKGAERGGFELVSEETTTAGTGAYPAVRFDWIGGPPGTPPGPSIDYVIDDGPQVLTVGIVVPKEDAVRMAPIIDDMIDSVTLP